MAYTFKNFEQSDESKKADAKAAEYDTYADSDKVTGLFNKYYDYETNNNPGEWTGGTHGQAKIDVYNEWNNRKPFSYDLNGDALYQQYKDQYVNQGRLAMADTIGQASAMTGGYGNSYAQSVGQQAYQGSLQQLNDRIPELYQLALDKYNQEGQDLLNKYGMVSDLYNTEYGEYQDKVSNYNTNLERLYNIANNERAYERGAWEADRTYYNTVADNLYDREFAAHNTNETNAFNAYTQDRNDYYQGEQLKISEAETAASLGDFSKLKALGYDTTKAEAAYTSSNDSYQLTAAEWNDISARCDEYIMNEDATGLKNYLKGLYNRGYITKDEYADFYEKFVPKVSGGGGGGGAHGINALTVKRK